MRGAAAARRVAAVGITAPRAGSEEPYLDQLARGHPLLRFEAGLEAEFREHYRRNSARRVQTGLIAATVLALISVPLTHLVFRPPPELLRWFDLVIGGGLIPLALGTLLASRYDRQMRVLTYALMAGILLTTALLVTLRVLFERRGLHYPFSIENYICVLIFLLAGWRFFVAMAIALSALMVTLTADLVLQMPLAGMFEHAFNLVATGTFASAGCYLAEHLSRTHFLQRHIIRFRASHDGLTRLLNRRSFDEQFTRIWAEAQARGCCVGVMVADADHFKQYNDAYGHAQGDAALQALAAVLRAQAGHRPLDLVARLGGEEFAAVWFDVASGSAKILAERFRSGVGARAIAHAAAPSGRLSVSVGLAVVQPRPGMEPSDALATADAALYQAKRSGRDRVVLSGAAGPSLAEALPAIDRRHATP